MAFFKNFIEALKSKRVWASMITCFFLVMSSTVVPDVSQEKVLIALVLGDSVRATVPKVEE